MSTDVLMLAQFDAAVRLLNGDPPDGLGIVQRNTRLFRAGDLVAVEFWNGQGERWPVTGRSSRGYDVVRAYMQGYRHRDIGCWWRASASKNLDWLSAEVRAAGGHRHIRSEPYNNKSTMALVELPGEFRSGGSEVDPATLRRWLVEALRAGHAASRVGSGSPALLPLEPCPQTRSRRRHRNAWEKARWAEEEQRIDEAIAASRPPPIPATARRVVFCAQCGIGLAEEVYGIQSTQGWGEALAPVSAAYDRHRAMGDCPAVKGWTFGEWA